MIRFLKEIALLLMLLQSFFATAQQDNFISFSDSLTIAEHSFFLYNLVRVKSAGRLVTASVFPPTGWKLLGDTALTAPVNSDSVSYIPITLIKQTGASAIFNPVKLRVAIQGGNQMVDTFFFVRARAIDDFSVTTPQESIDVLQDAKSVTVPLLIKNKGTTAGHYRVTVRQTGSSFDEHFMLRLPPGADSLLQCRIAVVLNRWQGQQKLIIKVNDSTGVVQSLPLTLTRLNPSGKLHATRYGDFPAAIETGIMRVDKQLSYIVAIQGSIPLPKGGIDLSFRSKQYGMANTLERNVFMAQVRQGRWDIAVGQLNEIAHFFSYGRGLRAQYDMLGGYQVGVQAIIHTLPGPFTNNTYRLSLQRQQGNVLGLYRLVANIDRKKGVQEYLVYHENSWKPAENISFKFNVAVGWERFLRLAVNSSGDPALGVGYNFTAIGKKKEWTSAWQYHPLHFPGVDKGFKNHQHQIRWVGKKRYFDLFYLYNRVVSTLLLDTVYYADAFRFNMEKLGIRAGFRKDRSDLSFSVGLFRQAGLLGAQLPSYRFGEIFFSTLAKPGHRFSIKSLSGYTNDKSVTRPVFINNTTLNYQVKDKGVRVFFLQQPTIKDSIVKVILRMNRTLLLSPYVNVRVFKRISVNLRYSLSQTRFDKRITSAAGITAGYNNTASGWQFNFSGSFPISRSSAAGIPGINVSLFNISVKKSLRIPMLLKRRYHDLSVITYEDRNANRQLDTADRLLPDIRIRVNKYDFITDKKGEFTWRNIDTGQYQVTVIPSSRYRGILPPADLGLSTRVLSATKLLIPFSKSCIVSGQVTVALDPYSNTEFTPEDILVKAIDSTGKEYATLTNQKGLYFINLPAGRYTVTLNPHAFTGSIKPDVLYRQIDLRYKNEEEVNFTLMEKKRPVRMLKQ